MAPDGVCYAFGSRDIAAADLFAGPRLSALDYWRATDTSGHRRYITINPRAGNANMVYTRLASYIALAFILLLVASVCAGGNAVNGTITFDGDPTIPDGAVARRELPGRLLHSHCVPDYRES